MEDKAIVRLYLDRDENAIAQTAGKYGARLRSLSLGITRDAQTAEECENDTYLEAWNRIPPNKPETRLYAFLARITRHISIDRCRERASLKRGGALVELTAELEQCLPSAQSTENDVDMKLLGEAIGRFLQTLPREKRVMFVRRYFYLDSVPEIAKRLQTGESRVKTTLFRIRGALREYLTGEGYTV